MCASHITFVGWGEYPAAYGGPSLGRFGLIVQYCLCIKARVCNIVQKHILLYWVKWSFYPESSQYIMYTEKGTKIIGPLWQLQDWESDQSLLSAPPSTDWSVAFMSHPLSPFPVSVKRWYQILELFCTFFCRNTELPEKTFIWLQWQRKCSQCYL